MRTITKGATDQSVELYITNDSTGLPATGLVFNSPGIDLWYRRPGAAKTSITEVTLAALTTAHTDGGFLEIGNGVYRLDLPDAAWATGVDHVCGGGTFTGYTVYPWTVQLTAFDLQTATPTAEVATASLQKVTGYTTITNVATSDNLETIIEAASAGTLIRLAPGTHTRNAEVAVPSGVTIMGAGMDQTILTGDPGDGTNALLRVNGTNEISDLKIVNVADGHGIATTLSGVAGYTIMRRLHIVGKQDCIGIQPPASGYAQFLVEDCVIDCSHWDGLTIITGDVHGTVRNTEFRAFGNGAGSGHKAIFITTFTGSDINVTVENCVCNSDAALNATNAFIFGNDAGGGGAKVSVLGTTHSGPMAFLAGNSSTIQYQDRGGNNIYQFANALTGGSAVIDIPAAAANAAVVAGTVGTNAATAATQATAAASSASTAASQATTAATQSTAAASSAATAVTQTTAAAQRAALGFAAANADTQLSGIAANATTAAAATAEATAAKVAAQAVKVVTDALDPLLPASTIAAAEDVESGGGTPVSPDVIDDSRTWFATDSRARNIITVGDNFVGTLALQPDINPGTTISTVDSVSITGAATVTATGLTVNRAKTRAHFTVPTLTTTGTYTVVVTVTTIDGQTIPTTATLKVQ